MTCSSATNRRRPPPDRRRAGELRDLCADFGERLERILRWLPEDYRRVE
jgi:hypothetical protein